MSGLIPSYIPKIYISPVNLPPIKEEETPTTDDEEKDICEVMENEPK
jgi:hypothetical protein